MALACLLPVCYNTPENASLFHREGGADLVQREEVLVGVRSYEALFVIKPDLDAEQTQAVVDKFTNLIVNNGGEIIQVDKWGKKRLAYEVRKYREGYYVLLQFKGAPAVAQELERVFKITDEVIRYMITRLEEKVS